MNHPVPDRKTLRPSGPEGFALTTESRRYNQGKMTTSNEILDAAMSLPPEVRAQIAEQLLDSLDPERAQIDAAWAVEIESRIQEIEDGRVELIPHDRVVEQARHRL
jgi:putative addiction module component (TIGR02574 family)